MTKYTLKDVLFGLREAYLENERQLNELKKHITIPEDAKLEEMDLYTYKNKKNYYLQLNVKAQQSMIVHLLETLTNRKVHNDNVKQIEIANNFDEVRDYLLLPKNNLYKVDLEQLCREGYKVLNSEFTRNIYTPVIRLEDSKIDLQSTTNGIVIHTEDFGKYPASGIIYNAKNDNVLLTPYYDSIFQYEVASIFDAEVPSDVLPNYHNKVIASSKVFDKDLAIQGLSGTKDTQTYKIKEKEHEILLSRYKK